MTKLFTGLMMVVSLTASLQGMTQAQLILTMQTSMNQLMQPQACPMQVTGADIAIADTKDGVALTFTAKSAENVAEVRNRVKQIVKIIDSIASTPRGDGFSQAYFRKYEEVSNGTRLTLTPRSQSILKKFREGVAARVEDLKKGDCTSLIEFIV